MITVCLFVLLVVVGLAGCKTNGDTALSASKFRVDLSLPKEMEAGKPFLLEGTLVNKSHHTWQVDYGADIFSYVVLSDKGENVLPSTDMLVVDSIGLMKTLKPFEKFGYDGGQFMHPHNNECTLPAGKYKAVAKAKFRIQEGSRKVDFELESEPVSFTVS